MPATPFPLGRIQQHDERSKAFRATVPGEVRTVTHRIPPLYRRLDQGNLGSCEGNGTVHCLGTQPLKKRFARYRTEKDAVKVYSLATVLDGFPGTFYYPPTEGDGGEDTGTSNVAAAKAAKSLGWISEYRWHFGLQDTLAGLTESPLLAGVPWYEGMFDLSREGYLNPTGREVGGHAFCLFGVNVEEKYVLMLNSWSNWGVDQTAKISFDALGFLLDNGGEITQFVV